MSHAFDALLAQALAGLNRGEDVQSILAHYVERASELEPLLRVAAYIQAIFRFVEPPSEGAMAANRRRLLDAAARQWAAAPVPWWRRLPLRLPTLVPLPSGGLAMAALLAVLLVVTLTGVTVAASGSLPGGALYPVKLVAEETQLALTFDPVARTDLQTHFSQTRRDEAQAVVAAGRRTTVRFEAEFQGLDGSAWIVGGLRIQVDEQAAVQGQPAPGDTVLVEALSPGDGTLRATQLTIRPPAAPALAPTGTPTLAPSRTPAPTMTPTLEPAATASHTPAPPTETRPPQPSDTPTRLPAPTRTRMSAPPTQHSPSGGMPSGPMMTPMITPQPTSDHRERPTSMPMPTRMAEPTHGPGMPMPTHMPEPTRGPEMPMPTHAPEPIHGPGMPIPGPTRRP